MTRDVVCISRTTGAGGETVGRLVAEQLGFAYVDEDIIVVASRKAGVDPSVVAKAEERAPLFIASSMPSPWRPRSPSSRRTAPPT